MANATVTPRLKDKARGIHHLTGEGSPVTLGLVAPDGTTYDDLTPGGGSMWQMVAGTWKQFSFAGGSYLLLTGGTLTGALIGTTATFSGAVAGSLINGVGSSATSIVHQSYVTGDGFARGLVQANGLIGWGSGSASADTNLYRNAAAQLKTDGALIIGGAVTGASFTSAPAGWTMGSVSGAARVLYGASATTAFSLLNTSNGYADLYMSTLFAQASVNAAGGQVRAAGWFNTGDTTGPAAEIGYTGGVAYFIGYNRSASAYTPIAINASTISIQAHSGTELLATASALTYGGVQVATIAYGSSPPTSSTPGVVGTLFGVT